MLQKYSLLTFDLLDDFLQQMSAPTQLDSHTLVSLLWDTPLVKNHLALHPKDQSLPRGRIVGLALRSFLHNTKPPRLFAKLKIAWNKFLFLDVKYFYPFAHMTQFPKSYSELGVWLYDKDQLSLVIADGDPLVARRLATENQDFWDTLIPDDAVPSPQTLSARNKSSIKDFREALIKQLELWDSLLSSGTNESSVSDAPDKPLPTNTSIKIEDAQLQGVDNEDEIDHPTAESIQHGISTSFEPPLSAPTNTLDDASLQATLLKVLPTDKEVSLQTHAKEEAVEVINPIGVSSSEADRRLVTADPPQDTADNYPAIDISPSSSPQERKITQAERDDTLDVIRRQWRQVEEAREEQTRQWASASLFLREYFARYNHGQQSTPYLRFVSTYSGEVSPQELDYIAWTVSWREFLIQQGIPHPTTDELYWRNDPEVVKRLLNLFATTENFEVQVKSAVLLRQCDLLVRSMLRLSLFKCRWIVVAEEIAQIAVNLNLTLLRRSLAEAIVAKEDVLLALVNSDTNFIPFVHKLALKIAKHLEYDFSFGKWFIASY